MAADGQSFVVRGVNYMLTSIVPNLADDNQKQALDRLTYNTLGYYIYNGCVHVQAVMGIAIPIISLLAFTLRFATGFWFLFAAELVKRSVFLILIRHEIGSSPDKPNNDDHKEAEGTPKTTMNEDLYLIGRIYGTSVPNRHNDVCVLKKFGFTPSDHNRWSCQKSLLWGLASGFNLLPKGA